MAFTVCITKLDEGGYKVYTESEANEAMETPEAAEPGEVAPMPGAAPAMDGGPGGMPPEGMEEGPAETEPGSQTVQTVKEALTLALEALKNDGQMSDQNGQEAAFNEGFGQKGGM